jgi:hypothetical protein
MAFYDSDTDDVGTSARYITEDVFTQQGRSAFTHHTFRNTVGATLRSRQAFPFRKIALPLDFNPLLPRQIEQMAKFALEAVGSSDEKLEQEYTEKLCLGVTWGNYLWKDMYMKPHSITEIHSNSEKPSIVRELAVAAALNKKELFRELIPRLPDMFSYELWDRYLGNVFEMICTLGYANLIRAWTDYKRRRPVEAPNVIFRLNDIIDDGFYVVLKFGHYEALKALVKMYHLDENQGSRLTEERHKELLDAFEGFPSPRFTRPQFEDLLCDAIWRKDPKAVSILGDIDYSDRLSMATFKLICWLGDLPSISALIDTGIVKLNVPYPRGGKAPGPCPLDVAIWTGNIGLVSLLLEKGANPDGPGGAPSSVSRPLNTAIEERNFDVVKLLLEPGRGTHIWAGKSTKWSSMALAARTKNQVIYEFLREIKMRAGVSVLPYEVAIRTVTD